MDALNQGGAVPSALQMIDSTVIRTHHQAAGAKGGLHDRVSAVLERPVGKRSTGSFSGPPSTSRPRSTSSSMHTGWRWIVSAPDFHALTEDFPRIAAPVPLGLSAVSYALALSACTPFRTDWGAVLEKLNEADQT